MGRRGLVVVAVLFGCAAALTAGVVLVMAYAPHHVQIAGDGPPPIFEEAVPGRRQRESVVWAGGDAVIASAGEVTTCSFAPVDGSAAQQLELHEVGRLRAPAAPWQWSGTPTVAAPTATSGH